MAPGARTPEESGTLEFRDAAAWDAWLAAHAGERTEAWLRVAKKRGPADLIGIADAGDVALCHGWIDSHRRSLDALSFLQRYSPRRAESPWSAINARRAEALADAGRMRSGGRREMDEARADGRWEAAYAPQGEAEIPPDFREALDRAPAASAVFAAMGKSTRYLLLLPILKATSPGTRARRIGKAIAELEASAP